MLADTHPVPLPGPPPVPTLTQSTGTSARHAWCPCPWLNWYGGRVSLPVLRVSASATRTGADTKRTKRASS